MGHEPTTGDLKAFRDGAKSIIGHAEYYSIANKAFDLVDPPNYKYVARINKNEDFIKRILLASQKYNP